VSRVTSRIGLATLFAIALGMTGAPRGHYSPREKAFYADATTVAFVRPGLVFKVTGAQIASDGTIAAMISITDPQGLPLDRAGVTWREFKRSGWTDVHAFTIANALDAALSHLIIGPVVGAIFGGAAGVIAHLRGKGQSNPALGLQ
jgi:hypothetical protein